MKLGIYFFHRILIKLICLDPIDLIFYRERASQPARNKRRRHQRRKVEGGMKAAGRYANMACLSRTTSSPPSPPLLTPPFKCETASWPALHFLSTPPPPPPTYSPQDYRTDFGCLGQTRGWPPF